jgi:serine O-acetyltransferase
MTTAARQGPGTPQSMNAGGGDEEQKNPLPAGDHDENPRGIGLTALLAEDFRTHGSSLLAPGFWALAAHRFGNWRMGIRSRALRAPLSLAYGIAHQGMIAMFGIDLPYNAKLGRRLRIDHHGAVFVGSREIGDDVRIRHAVTIGLRRRTDRVAPTIGSRVEIGPNACIVGDIHVGDESYICANTVLAQDVPKGATVLGVPGRVVDLARFLEPAVEEQGRPPPIRS